MSEWLFMRQFQERVFPDWTTGCLVDLQVNSDIVAMLETPSATPTIVAKLTNRMVADAVLDIRQRR